MYKAFCGDLKTFIEDNNTYPTATQDICLEEVICPNCFKKIWLESRFIIPLLPKVIECPYCDKAISIPKIKDKK